MDVRDMFRMPGAGLSSKTDIRSFDEIKATVDRCTSDFLIRPDWEQNLEVVDSMNAINSDAVRSEVMFLLRRKLSSSRSRTVSLTISLVEALVKNGGMRVHAAVGSEPFMKEMAKVARKYNGKSGSENIEVAELALDVIQAWGEAFLSRQKQFPAFVKTYHDLRKDGLQFKAQYDVTRVPIFTPAACDPNDGEGEDSGILKAAAIAASMSNRTTDQIAIKPKRIGSASADLMESMMTSMSILCEMLIASSSTSSLQSNDIAGEVAMQLRSLQNGLGAAIEYELTHESEGTELLFKMNDDSQMVLAVYDGIMNGTCTAAQAIEIVAILGNDGAIAAAPSATQFKSAPSSSSVGNGSDLLDFADSSAAESQRVWSTPAPALVTAPVPFPVISFPTRNATVATSDIPSFAFAPPPSAASVSAFYDPFDSDPFGPGTSSLDNLLASPPVAITPFSDRISNIQGNTMSPQDQIQSPSRGALSNSLDSLLSMPNPAALPPALSLSPTTAKSKHIVDLNALIFSGSSNPSSGFPVCNGYGQGQVQGFNREPQLKNTRLPWEVSTSPTSVPATLSTQNSYQPHQTAPYQFHHQHQQMSSITQPQPSFTPPNLQHAYSTPLAPMSPPPLPSSPPPPLSHQQQHNPFDSF